MSRSEDLSSRAPWKWAVLVTTGILLAALAEGTLATLEPDTRPAGVDEQRRSEDEISGRSIYGQETVQAYARSIGSSHHVTDAIPHYYELAPKIGIAPDVLIAQAIVETGRGHYGGDSRPWNMAGIKKGGEVGDEPRDFERPGTARAGVRMHVNHMAAYTGERPIGAPHEQFYDARAAQKAKGRRVTRISQLGDGIWATDPAYSGKIRLTLDDMAAY